MDATKPGTPENNNDKIDEDQDDDQSDSVIQEDEQVDFTGSVRFMKGTPLPTKLADKLRDDAVFDPSP